MTGAAGAANGGGTIDVLICDDVDAMRLLLGAVIELRPGLRVVGEARDGNEAISEASRVQPDVILLDLSMPLRTGFEALPEILEAAPDAQVIVLSGFLAATIETEVLALGAALFMEKGSHPDAINDAIEAVAARKLGARV
jgi:two-component system, NarL family, invasion response regulator UvrY